MSPNMKLYLKSVAPTYCNDQSMSHTWWPLVQLDYVSFQVFRCFTNLEQYFSDMVLNTHRHGISLFQ